MKPAAFVLASTDHGAMIVNRNDWNKVPEGFYGVGFQLLNTGAYERSEIDLIRQILFDRRRQAGDGIIALDCGANIGVHTVEMANYMTGWGEVIAFEAQERLFYALCGNIALANLFNANAILAAVGAEAGAIPVPQPDYNKPGSFGSLELQYNPKTEYIGQKINYGRKLNKVRLLTIDSLKLNRLDFIKLDVEGMELDVLEGAREAISLFKPHMLIERIKVDQTKLESMLSDFGYDITEYGMNLLATPKT